MKIFVILIALSFGLTARSQHSLNHIIANAKPITLPFSTSNEWLKRWYLDIKWTNQNILTPSRQKI
ncbi:hypothetical protein BCL90_5294 [Pedobacter alluvionis]|uniref:Uncharacterized protein n=1 Tax=Pedobacter alluvionis TaxID=475253 RepID=A0A497XMM2_9SPHI|nr:hypothetical protein BCL90_5294 [Pedobacter alluvionis]